MNNENTIQNLAELVTKLKGTDIPFHFDDQIKMGILDIMAVTIASQSSSDVFNNIKMYTKYSSGNGSIWWNNKRVSIFDASFINAYNSHRLDYDNILYATFGHPLIIILPTLFSIMDIKYISGRELINAIIIGIETMAQLGLIFGEKLRNYHYHPTPILGSLAATTAAGWLLNLSTQQMKNALTLTGSTLSGFKSSFGTMLKPYQVGMVARQSLTSTITALENPDIILEEKWIDNLFMLSNTQKNCNDIISFGENWVLDKYTFMFKFYPCCGYFHHTMNELKRIINYSGTNSEKIQKVYLTLPILLKDTSLYDWPQSFNESQFSLPFNLALIINFKDVRLTHYCDEQISNPSILETMKKLNIRYINNEESLTSDGYLKGKVKLILKNGESIEDKLILSDYGSDINFKQIEDKFLQCTEDFINEYDKEIIIDWVEYLEKTNSIEWRKLQNKIIITPTLNLK